MSKEKDFLEAQMLYQKQISDLQSQLAEKDLKIIELETKLNLKDKGTNV